ncbi:MAG TPA: hypothetical protein VF029_00135 [Actinomycetota bacterium]
MPPLRPTPPTADAEDLERLRRELLRLDPWAFWAVELDPRFGAPFGVLGVTGAFAVAASGLDGYLVAEGRRLLVDGTRVGGFRDVKRAAKRLRGQLIGIGAASEDVVPMLCLTRAVAGAPRDHAGVRVVRPEDLVPEITGRDRIVDPSTAERLAGRLGRVLTGPVRRPPEDP